jgi:hypothetical protein
MKIEIKISPINPIYFDFRLDDTFWVNGNKVVTTHDNRQFISNSKKIGNTGDVKKDWKNVIFFEKDSPLVPAIISAYYEKSKTHVKQSQEEDEAPNW